MSVWIETACEYKQLENTLRKIMSSIPSLMWFCKALLFRHVNFSSAFVTPAEKLGLPKAIESLYE